MIICPNCGKQNSADSRFCQYCRAQLSATPTVSPPSSPAVPPPSGSHAGQRPIVPPTAQPIGQLGSGGVAPGSIWGPFAGYGTRGRHASWLLDDLGDKAAALHQAVSERFQQREIPATAMRWQTLVAQGVLVERRPYFFLRRGITTVALYIAQFGKDLYISQVTYAKGPISNVRVGILIAMALFQLFFMFSFSDALGGIVERMLGSFSLFGGGSSSSGMGLLTFMLCCVFPLGVLNSLAWMFIGVFSVYKYLTEKDALAILRTPPNEFQTDDIIALEKAVEETVRQSLDAIGIDTSGLLPMAEEPVNALTRRLI